jgi:hypothetical protein
MRDFGRFAIVVFSSVLGTACGSGGPDHDATDGSAAEDRGSPRESGTSTDGPIGHAGEGGQAHRDASVEASARHDGGAVEGSSDAVSGDGSGKPITCGAATCFVGQSCVAGACEFTDCVGDHVPGDYATVQDAVTALAPTGGTICLGAQTYDETVGFAAPPSVSTTIVILGISPAETVLESLGVEGDQSSPSVVLKGLTLGSLNVAPYAGLISVTMSAGKLEGIGGAGEGGIDITLDGVEVTASTPSGAVISLGVTDEGSESLSITIENSYIHDTGGISLETEYGAGGTLSFSATFLNNTFVNNSTAIDNTAVANGSSTVTSSYYNNLFVDNGVALNLAAAGTTGNNALYGNTANYAGMAVDGPGYVKANPMLDASTPPGLQSGSPCRGTGNASHAPNHDYWGKPRGSVVDIGAVQSSP